jgi:alanyl-tRNA synthetase
MLSCRENVRFDVFCNCKQASKCRPYLGTVGRCENGLIDAAYRIVADHVRMFTIAISDGLVPGRRESE